MRNLIRSMVVLAASIVLPMAVPAAEHEGADDGSIRCISPSRIQSVNIISNRRILFETSGGRYFMNELPYACPSLDRNKTIIYRTSIDQLCDVDVITPADRLGGGMFPRGSCGLGRFHPMERGQVEALLKDISD